MDEKVVLKALVGLARRYDKSCYARPTETANDLAKELGLEDALNKALETSGPQTAETWLKDYLRWAEADLIHIADLDFNSYLTSQHKCEGLPEDLAKYIKLDVDWVAIRMAIQKAFDEVGKE